MNFCSNPKCQYHKHYIDKYHQENAPDELQVRDPVTRKIIHIARYKYRAQDGKTFYFCEICSKALRMVVR